ncbi:MAG: hypothetical protein AAF639_16915 [Chloroflexota bacterium]
MINDMKIIPDFRTPDNIRLAVTPLYTSFTDLHTAVMRVKQIMEERLYETYTTGSSKTEFT